MFQSAQGTWPTNRWPQVLGFRAGSQGPPFRAADCTLPITPGKKCVLLCHWTSSMKGLRTKAGGVKAFLVLKPSVLLLHQLGW